MLQSRILFICPSKSWGGLEMNVLRLSIWLNKRGRDILLYCDPNSELCKQAHENEIETRDLEFRSKFKDILQARKLVKSFKKENAGIVLFHLNKNFPMMSLVKFLSGGRLKLLYMQHMHLGGNKKDILHSFIYNQLDCWIAPLEMFAERLQQITTIGKSKIEVIPFGIELDKFTKCSYTKEEARQKLGLPVDNTIVGFIGRLDPNKCQHLLIEAVQKLQQLGVELDILFVGDSTRNEEMQYKQTLEDLIRSYNLQDKVHFKSHSDEIEIAFKALDIFCLTTGSETFGMVTVEAMASQIAVIGSDEGGTTEIIQHEKNGLLYKSGNSDDIAKKIKLLLDNSDFKNRLSTQAQKDAITNYSHTVQCNSLENCFNKFD